MSLTWLSLRVRAARARDRGRSRSRARRSGAAPRPSSMKPPDTRFGEIHVTRPLTSAVRSLSVRGVTVPWVRTVWRTVLGSISITRTAGRGAAGGLTSADGRVITISVAQMAPTASTRDRQGDAGVDSHETTFVQRRWAVKSTRCAASIGPVEARATSRARQAMAPTVPSVRATSARGTPSHHARPRAPIRRPADRWSRRWRPAGESVSEKRRDERKRARSPVHPRGAVDVKLA